MSTIHVGHYSHHHAPRVARTHLRWDRLGPVVALVAFWGAVAFAVIKFI